MDINHLVIMLVLAGGLVGVIAIARRDRIPHKKSAPARTYHQSVHGESFNNDDGTSRQAILARCFAGDDVDLVPEPTNRFDHDAIAVVVRGKGQIGYLPRGDMRPDETRHVTATIASINGGSAEKPSRGAVLLIAVFS